MRIDHAASFILCCLLVSVGHQAAAAPQTPTAEMLIDFGSSSVVTTGAPRTWNNIHPANMGQTTRLMEVGGSPTAVDLAFTPGFLFANAGQAGTSSATPGSPLDKLGYPTTALSDYCYGSNSSTPVEFTLSNLDQSAQYDFIICASRMSVSDIRTTDYMFQGLNWGSATLDAANNTSNIATVTGIVPDVGSKITVRLSAAASNTNSSGYFYSNALEIHEFGGSPPPPMLTINPGQPAFSRVVGKPAYPFGLTVFTNDALTPAVALTALDDLTGLAPTWLSVPASVTAGVPFAISVGHAAVPVGNYSATLTATAPGYLNATTPLTLTVRAADGPLNLLYYGNSFSMGNGTVPDLVRYIAEDFGVPAPNTIKRLSGGKDLYFHLTDSYHAAAITDALLPGEEWDYVVMQGYSTEATWSLGDPFAFLANAQAIMANVRQHSPAARAIMFQTWARAQGHSFYVGTNPPFAGPLDMHQQIEENYIQAVVNLNSGFGTDSARRAACGETAALYNFDPAIYATDLYHAGPPITTMSAMAIFTAIYRELLSEFEPNFGLSTSLIQRLTSFGMAIGGWREYSGIADRVADRELRHHPGSGEDLLLLSGVNGPETARPIADLVTGDSLSVLLCSPIGTHHGSVGLIVMHWFPTGSATGPLPGYPEIHFNLQQILFVATTPSLSSTPLTWQPFVSASVPGWSLLIQGISRQPSEKMGNTLFTMTDGHELRLK